MLDQWCTELIDSLQVPSLPNDGIEKSSAGNVPLKKLDGISNDPIKQSRAFVLVCSSPFVITFQAMLAHVLRLGNAAISDGIAPRKKFNGAANTPIRRSIVRTKMHVSD